MQRWLLTANVKGTTVKSISVVISLQSSLTQDQCKYLKLVRVSADFYGEYQSDEEAKHNMCLVFPDISHFRRFVTTYKLRVQPSPLGEDRESGGNSYGRLVSWTLTVHTIKWCDLTYTVCILFWLEMPKEHRLSDFRKIFTVLTYKHRLQRASLQVFSYHSFRWMST